MGLGAGKRSTILVTLTLDNPCLLRCFPDPPRSSLKTTCLFNNAVRLPNAPLQLNALAVSQPMSDSSLALCLNLDVQARSFLRTTTWGGWQTRRRIHWWCTIDTSGWLTPELYTVYVLSVQVVDLLSKFRSLYTFVTMWTAPWKNRVKAGKFTLAVAHWIPSARY